MDIQRNAQRLTLEQIMSTAHDLKLKVPESVDAAKARVDMLDPYIGRPASREDLINAQSPEEIERLVADMARHAALSNGPGAMAIQQAKTMLLDEYIRVMHEAAPSVYDEIMRKLAPLMDKITPHAGAIPFELAKSPENWTRFDKSATTAYRNVLDVLRDAQPLVELLEKLVVTSRSVYLPRFGVAELDALVSALPLFALEDHESPFLSTLKLPEPNKFLSILNLVYLTSHDVELRVATIDERHAAERRLAEQATQWTQTLKGEWKRPSEVEEHEVNPGARGLDPRPVLPRTYDRHTNIAHW